MEIEGSLLSDKTEMCHSLAPSRRPHCAAEHDSATDWRPSETPSKHRKSETLVWFLEANRNSLLELRTALVSSLDYIVRDAGLDRANGSSLCTASGDTCARDFALSLLSEGASALLEIDEALARVDTRNDRFSSRRQITEILDLNYSEAWRQPPGAAPVTHRSKNYWEAGPFRTVA